MTSRSNAKRLLAVLVLLAMLSSTWPVATATHVNDSVAVPPPSGFVPATGAGPVDDAVDAATAPADGAVDELNGNLAEAVKQPEIPATYFRDSFDLLGQDHLGGWVPGQWLTADSATPDQGVGWHLTTLPGSEREGFAFGDEAGYAIRSDRILNSFLVSPRISLDALPVDSPTGADVRGPVQPQSVGSMGSVGSVRVSALSEADAIRLYIDHRYNLACSDENHIHGSASQDQHPDPHILCNGSDGEITVTRYDLGSGIDSGQVLLFLNSPPTVQDLQNPTQNGQTLTPLQETMPPGGASGFTGNREQFYRSTFDLTHFAGQDAWIVLKAAVATQESPVKHFQRDDRFDLDLPYYGWQLDGVLLEGPAYAHNVKVDEILHPRRVVDGQLELAPGDDQDPLAMVVLNRGQFSETVRPKLTLTDSAGQSDEYDVGTVTLRPGETRAVVFEDSLPFLDEGEGYTALFEAELVGHQDAYSADNSKEVTFEARRNPGVLLAEPLAVTPRTGDPAAERQATVTILNRGNGRESVAVELLAEYEDPSDGSLTDVTQEVVLDASPASISETFILEPGQSRELDWAIILETPGKYRFSLDGTLDVPDQYGLVEFGTEARAATLLSEGTIYETDFTSNDGWQPQPSGDTKPPCTVGHDGQACPDFVWEMPSQCSQSCKTLIAFADTDHLGEDPDTPIESLRIDVTQWLDAPCRTRADGLEDECRYPGRFSQLWSGSQGQGSSPTPHSSELWYRSPLQGQLPGPLGSAGTPLVPGPTQANTVLQEFRFGYFSEASSKYNDGGNDLTQSHPSNRLNHYSGTWISETHHVPIADFAQRWQNQEWTDLTRGLFSAPETAPMPTMPLAAFDDLLNLRFVGGNGGGCDTGGDSWRCPSWRVSQAVVTAITSEGEELVLAQWNGQDANEDGKIDEFDETVGHWGVGSDYERDLDALADTLAPAGFSQNTGWRIRGVDSLGDGEAEEYNRFDATSGWQQIPSYGGRSGVWTNADGPKDANGVPMDEAGWTHSNLQNSLLQSPPIDIDADAATPKLEFDHRFHLLRDGMSGNPQTAKNCCWISDHGSLMVRFVDINGEPTTPYMQVALEYDPPLPFDPLTAAQGLKSQVHRFYDNDCAYYDRSDCDPRDPNRAPVTHQLDLDRLPILDYSRVLVPPQGGHYWTQCSDGRDNDGDGRTDTDDPQCQSSNGNWESPDFPELETPQAEPDLQALRLVDLRDGSIVWQKEGNEDEAPRLCEATCHVQFGFRVQTGVHPSNKDNHPKSGTGAWSYGYADNAPVGWFIERFHILADEAQGHDIAVTDASLETSYAWESVGLGPGDEAQLVLELENRGLFEQPVEGGSISVDVLLQRLETDGSHTDISLPNIELPPSVVLPGLLSGAPLSERKTQVSIPIPVPDIEGSYRLLATAHLDGDLIPDQPGLLPVADEASADNCAAVVLDADGAPAASLGECEISVLSPLPVRATPKLEVEIDVSPRAGLAGEAFPREVPITIRNTGNVEVHDFLVTRFFTDEEKETHVRQWLLPVSPPVGGSASLLELLLQDDEYEPQQDDYWVPLLKTSRYEAGVGIKLDSEDPDFVDQDVLIIESFDSFYSDAFVSSPDYGAGRVTSGVAQPTDVAGPWQTVLGTGPGGDSRGWHFGDSERQTYPDQSDEALLLPPLDLSSVARGSLSITHRYDFEEGYDGGRVEASLDDGETWRPLVPQRGYVSLQDGRNTIVYPDNPMNADQDPLAQTPAWTGSSDGWTTDEFHLGQVDELVSETLLYEFSQEGYTGNLATINEREVPGEDSDFDRASFSTTWAHPATATCSATDPLLETCWYREDVHMGSPARNPAGDADHNGKYWWTGESDDMLALSLGITIPAADEERYPVLSFWRWEDTDAARAFSFWINRDNDVEGELQRMETSDFRFSEDLGARTDDGWRRFTMNLAGFQDATNSVTVPVEFRFDPAVLHATGKFSDRFRDPFRDRGGLVDDVQLLSVQRITDKVVDSQLFNTDALEWDDDPQWSPVETIPTPSPAWNPQEIAGRAGSTTAFLFGNTFDTDGDDDDPDEYYNYPKDAHERLVSPIIDLQAVGGKQARASFWEAFNFQYNGDLNTGGGANIDQDRLRQIMVQPLLPTLEGEVPGPWISMAEMEGMHSRGCEEPRPPGWCQRTVDLSDFIGQRIRLGFEIRTDSLDADAYCLDQALKRPSRLGCYWAIDGVQVFADTVAGQPMLVRLRAASDGTVGDGGWTVDSIQLVGYAYEENVAVLPDQSLDDREVAPGDTFTLSGQVRNLGEFSTANLPGGSLALQATATTTPPPSVDPKNLDIDFDIEGGGPLMEFTLHGAGAKNDRTDYEISVTVPSDATPDTRYTINVNVVTLTGAGTPTPFSDDNTGDHRRAFNLVVDDAPELEPSTSGSISPLTAEDGEPVKISVDFASIGTVPAAVDELVFTVTDARTGEAVAASPELNSSNEEGVADIAPGDSRSIQWTWSPAEGTQGFFRVDAEFKYSYPPEGAIPRDLSVGVVLVGEKPIYYQETFDVDALADAGWFSSQACSSSRDCWRLREDISYVGEKSVYVGPDDLASGTHKPRQDVRLEGPMVDLTALELLNELDFRDSPFSPSLTFRYQANVGANDGVIVEAIRPEKEDGDTYRYLDTEDYSGNLQAGNAMLNNLGSTTVDAFTDGRLDTWRPVSVPLGPVTGSSNGVALLNEGRLVGHDVSFAFRFGSSLDGDRGQAFTVDAVTVSSYASRVEPAALNADLTTGADKVFHFVVQNTGPARDTYTVSLAPESTLNVFDVDILTPTLTLAAGESALAKVRVAAPNFELGGGAGGFLLLEVASLGDPNSVATSAVTLTYLAKALPDLSVRLDRPEGGAAKIDAGTPTSFLATVTNIAAQKESRPTDLEVGVCPWITGDPATDLDTCRADGTWKVLAKRSLGLLEPGDVQTEPVTWIPEEAMAGRVHIIAEADPARLLHEPRENNLDAQAMDVLIPDRPHLRVVPGSLQVTRAQEEVHQAIEGDLLQITGKIENIGSADAQDVLVRLVNQFPLLSKHLDRLAPGQEVSFSTQWRAEPGNWVILLEIIPGLGSSQEDETGLASRWDLAVEGGHVGLSFDPEHLRLEPGQAQQAFIRVVNDRATTTTFVARLHGQDDVLLTGLPARFNLTSGEVQEYPVDLTASPFAKAGARTIEIALHTDPLLDPVAKTGLEVVVGPAEPVTLHARPVATGSDTARIGVEVTNHGSRSAGVQVEPDGPDGWNVATPAAIQVEPGATRTIEILASVPPGTAPGKYPIALRSEGVERATAIVEVLPAPRWASSVEYTTLTEDGATIAWVRVENTGNAAGLPILDVLGDQPETGIEPALAILAPGQMQVYRVHLDDGNALVLPGEEGPAQLPEPGDGNRVQVMRWEVLPRGGLKSGDTGRIQVELLNPRTTAQAEYPLVLYVNGFPAAESAVSLEAGGTAKTELAWTARPGEHAVSVAHGEMEETTINGLVTVDAEDNKAPGASPLLVVLLLVGAALGRWKRK